MGLDVSSSAEASNCVIDETPVKLQKKSSLEDIKQKQTWEASTETVDSFNYKKFRLSCSNFNDKNMVLSKSLEDGNNDNMLLSIRGKICIKMDYSIPYPRQ